MMDTELIITGAFLGAGLLAYVIIPGFLVMWDRVLDHMEDTGPEIKKEGNISLFFYAAIFTPNQGSYGYLFSRADRSLPGAPDFAEIDVEILVDERRRIAIISCQGIEE